MIYNKSTGKVCVLDREKGWPGLTFPGGHTEWGESFYDSAVREAKEETGLDVSKLIPCGTVHWANKQSGERGAGCVENVIADEYGGNGFVKAVADPKGLDGTLVTLIRQSAQAHLAYTGISSFTAGEIRRTEKKEYI